MSLSSYIIPTPPDGPGTYLPARPSDSANSTAVDRAPTTVDDAEERGFRVLMAMQLSQLKPDVFAAKPAPSSKERTQNLSTTSPIYEELYLRIGRWVGPFARPDAKRTLLDEWKRYGADAALWLVQRIKHERNLDALEGATEVLTSMGSLAAPYLIGALRVSADEHDVDSQLKYIRILEWFASEDVVPWAANLEGILELVSHSTSSELRESTYRCISLLSHPARLFERALAAESDPDLRCLLEDQQGKSG
jgi:hypothetical protein